MGWILDRTYATRTLAVMTQHSDPDHGTPMPATGSAEDLYKSVLDACFDRVYVFDTECRYLFVGQHALRALGLHLSEVVGRHWRELNFPAELMELFEQEVREVVRTAKPAVNRSRGWAEHGIAPTDYVISPLRDASGDVAGVVVVARPVVQGEELEQALREYSQPELSAQAEAVGVQEDAQALKNWVAQQRLAREATRLHRALLRSISHDFRIPLTSIIASLGEISEESGQIPLSMIQELARTGLGQAQRLERFLDNLLAAAQLEGARLVPHLNEENPVSLLAEVMERCEKELEDHLVEWEMQDGLPDIAADRMMVVQALTNVLTNAANHTEEGTVIRLFVSADSSALTFRVQDEGPGIPPAAWSDVPLDDRPPGDVPSLSRHGLGLEIVRAIVAAHGGRVEIGTPPEGGASVSLVLPLAREQ